MREANIALFLQTFHYKVKVDAMKERPHTYCLRLDPRTPLRGSLGLARGLICRRQVEDS